MSATSGRGRVEIVSQRESRPYSAEYFDLARPDHFWVAWRMRAAYLVAMNQRGDRHLRTRPAGVQHMRIGNAGVAFAVLGDRDGQQRIGGQRGHRRLSDF